MAGRPGVFVVEVYAAVRQFVFVEGRSREAARVFGLNQETITKICRFSVPPPALFHPSRAWVEPSAPPPGYRREKPPAKPKLGPLVPVIDAILASDREALVKQRRVPIALARWEPGHTAQRMFERLRDEHGYTGGYTVVKDYVRPARLRLREAFVPLSHPPGHAQVDFGQCIGFIGGVRTVMHVFCIDLPHSDAPFVKAYRRRRRRRFWTAMCPPLASSAACLCRSSTTTPSWRWRGFLGMGSGRGRAPSPS
jgi:hypothetical protein